MNKGVTHIVLVVLAILALIRGVSGEFRGALAAGRRAAAGDYALADDPSVLICRTLAKTNSIVFGAPEVSRMSIAIRPEAGITISRPSKIG
jgi:hypothetical protein